MQVLLIDDDPHVLEVVSLALEEMGHAVEVLSSARHATEAVTAGTPDVVLVDLQLPGLSGEAWLHDATSGAFGRDSTFVVLSGADEDVLERVVTETCAVGYIRKQDGAETFATSFAKLTGTPG